MTESKESGMHQEIQETSGEKKLDEAALVKLREQSRINRAELQQLIERGELDPEPYSFDTLQWFIEDNTPIQRKDLGRKAIVLTYEELHYLNGFDAIHTNGKMYEINPADAAWYGKDDRCIIRPDQLGNLGDE